MVISFIIGFVVGAIIMIFAFGLVSGCKDRKPRNKVRFFVGKTLFGTITLLLIDKIDATVIAYGDSFEKYGLNAADYFDLKPMGRREVFLNLED